jgi:hypothetical protein
MDMNLHSCNIEDLWGTVFYVGDPNVIMACLTFSTLPVWLQQRNTQAACHVSGSLICPCNTEANTSLFPSAVLKGGTGGSYVEKPFGQSA